MSNHLYTITENHHHIETRLLYVTSAKYEGDWHSTPHSHHFSEFFYVLGGRGRFLVDSQSFDVEEHDLVIVNPHVAHTEMSRQSSPLEYIALGIEGVCFTFDQPEADENYRLFHYKDKPVSARQEFLSYLHALLREAEKNEAYSEEVCQNLLEVLMIIMMRHSEFTLSVMPSKKANLACAKVKRYIDGHFRESLSLDELAGLVHVNKYHLVHIFTADFGLSPIQYLISRRVDESKNLLRTTDHSIAQIASFSGFSSQSYFAQTFQKSMGMSPTQYRRQTRASNS